MLGVDGLNPVKPTKGEPRRAKSTLKPRTNTEPDKKSSMPILECRNSFCRRNDTKKTLIGLRSDNYFSSED